MMNTNDKMIKELNRFELEFKKNYVYGSGAKTVDKILNEFEFDWELEMKLVAKLDKQLEREAKKVV